MKFEDVKYRLNPGEEVRILKGVTFYAKPSRVVFIKEYPNHLKYTSPSRHRTPCQPTR